MLDNLLDVNRKTTVFEGITALCGKQPNSGTSEITLDRTLTFIVWRTGSDVFTVQDHHRSPFTLEDVSAERVAKWLIAYRDVYFGIGF